MNANLDAHETYSGALSPELGLGELVMWYVYERLVSPKLRMVVEAVMLKHSSNRMDR